jgi:hypothetical protein
VLVGGNNASSIVQHHLKQIFLCELCCRRCLRNDDASLVPRINIATFELRNLDLPLRRVNQCVWMQAAAPAERPDVAGALALQDRQRPAGRVDV